MFLPSFLLNSIRGLTTHAILPHPRLWLPGLILLAFDSSASTGFSADEAWTIRVFDSRIWGETRGGMCLQAYQRVDSFRPLVWAAEYRMLWFHANEEPG